MHSMSPTSLTLRHSFLVLLLSLSLWGIGCTNTEVSECTKSDDCLKGQQCVPESDGKKRCKVSEVEKIPSEGTTETPKETQAEPAQDAQEKVSDSTTDGGNEPVQEADPSEKTQDGDKKGCGDGCPPNSICRDDVCRQVCQNDKECADIDSCQRTDGQKEGLCLPSVSPKALGQVCNDKSPCPAGFVCLVTKQGGAGDGQCFQDCSNGATTCLSNQDRRKDCSVLNDGQTAICTSPVEEGKDCDLLKSRSCRKDSKTPLYCSQSTVTCKKMQVQTAVDAPCSVPGDTKEPFAICDSQQGLYCEPLTRQCKEGKPFNLHEKCAISTGTVCQKDLTCVRLSNQSQHGYCLSSCDPASTSACGGKPELCQPTRGQSLAKGFCLPAGPRKPQEACKSAQTDPDADTLPTSQFCEAGSLCIVTQQGAPQGICMKQTDSCQKGCGTGEQCLPIGGGAGVCAKTCTSGGSDCKEQGTACTALIGGSPQICTAARTTGPGKAGNKCSLPLANNGCEKGLFCLRQETAQGSFEPGFCSADCSQGASCPDGTASDGKNVSSTCIALDGSGKIKACLFLCSSQACPDGLQCRSVGGNKVCLP